MVEKKTPTLDRDGNGSVEQREIQATGSLWMY